MGKGPWDSAMPFISFCPVYMWQVDVWKDIAGSRGGSDNGLIRGKGDAWEGRRTLRLLASARLLEISRNVTTVFARVLGEWASDRVGAARETLDLRYSGLHP